MKPFFFFLCFIFLFGCEKATKYNSSPRDNFEALWRIMTRITASLPSGCGLGTMCTIAIICLLKTR